jgi:hypothetical protein
VCGRARARGVARALGALSRDPSMGSAYRRRAR